MSRNRLRSLMGQTREICSGSMNAKGRFLADIAEGQVEISGGLKGEISLVEFGKASKTAVRAKHLAFVTQPAESLTPPCGHFLDCGGCKLQQAPLTLQRRYKEELIQNFVNELDLPLIQVHGNDTAYGYRNKMEFTFSEKGLPEPKKSFGLHAEGRFQTVVPLSDCLLPHDSMRKVFALTRDFFYTSPLKGYNPHTHQGVFRHLVVRGSLFSGKVLCNLVATVWDDSFLEWAEQINTLPEAGSIWFTKNEALADAVLFQETKHLGLDTHLVEKIGDYEFELGLQSFLQVNASGASEMMHLLGQRLKKIGVKGVLWDLYCGVGMIGICLSQFFDQVVGIEEIPSAIEDARRNAEKNGLKHFTYHVGSVEKSDLSQLPKPDMVIVDPPRSGMHPKALQALIQLKPPNLCLIFCNPAQILPTLKPCLAAGYRIVDSFSFDLFPQTPHVETLFILRL